MTKRMDACLWTPADKHVSVHACRALVLPEQAAASDLGPYSTVAIKLTRSAACMLAASAAAAATLHVSLSHFSQPEPES